MGIWERYLRKAGACTCGVVFGLGLGAEIVHLAEAPCAVHRELACKPEITIQPHSTDATTLTLRLGETMRLVDGPSMVNPILELSRD